MITRRRAVLMLMSLFQELWGQFSVTLFGVLSVVRHIQAEAFAFNTSLLWYAPASLPLRVILPERVTFSQLTSQTWSNKSFFLSLEIIQSFYIKGQNVHWLGFCKFLSVFPQTFLNFVQTFTANLINGFKSFTDFPFNSRAPCATLTQANQRETLCFKETGRLVAVWNSLTEVVMQARSNSFICVSVETSTYEMWILDVANKDAAHR